MKQPETGTTRVHQTRCIFLTGGHIPEEAEPKLVHLQTSSPADTVVTSVSRDPIRSLHAPACMCDSERHYTRTSGKASGTTSWGQTPQNSWLCKITGPCTTTGTAHTLTVTTGPSWNALSVPTHEPDPHAPPDSVLWHRDKAQLPRYLRVARTGPKTSWRPQPTSAQLAWQAASRTEVGAGGLKDVSLKKGVDQLPNAYDFIRGIYGVADSLQLN